MIDILKFRNNSEAMKGELYEILHPVFSKLDEKMYITQVVSIYRFHSVTEEEQKFYEQIAEENKDLTNLHEALDTKQSEYLDKALNIAFDYFPDRTIEEIRNKELNDVFVSSNLIKNDESEYIQFLLDVFRKTDD